MTGKEVLRNRQERRVTTESLAWGLCGFLCEGRRKAGTEQVGAGVMAGAGSSQQGCLCCGCAALEFKGENLGSGKGSVGGIGREEESEMNSQGTAIKWGRGKKDFKGDRRRRSQRVKD